jgi:hypothetical protein
MDIGPMVRDGGAGVAFLMAGLGALKFFWTGASAVARLPTALEHQIEIQQTTGAAIERTAQAAECCARLIPTLEKLEVRREEIENSIGVLARNYEEIAELLRKPNGKHDGTGAA